MLSLAFFYFILSPSNLEIAYFIDGLSSEGICPLLFFINEINTYNYPFDKYPLYEWLHNFHILDNCFRLSLFSNNLLT